MNATAVTRPARARLGMWPHEPHTAHLVLLDHHMVPTADDVRGWVVGAGARGATSIRTGALFPAASPVFLAEGFRIADTLVLLERPLTETAPPVGRGPRSRRLRRPQLSGAAALDRRSFPTSWSNDATALGEIMDATPQHRARAVFEGRRMVAFAISGRAGRTGYIQRLAVDPDARRRGIGRALVDDAVRWMHRRGCRTVMVNTDADNDAALALYRSLGFRAQADPLLILEHDLATP